MYKKHCTRCYHSSYSSCNVGEWLCPTCSHDLTNMKAIFANNHKELYLYNNYEKQNFGVPIKSIISYKI